MRVETYSDRWFLDVVRLVENFHKEAVSEWAAEFSAESLIETIKAQKEEGAKNCFLLIAEDGSCQGMIYGTRFKSPFSETWTFQEVAWYVNAAHRGQGLRLLNEVEKILKSQGIGVMIMAVLKNSNEQKLMAFYERLGYRRMETHYVRNL